MDRLWSPWRMEYIKGADRFDGCIFCDLPAKNDDEKNLILHRGSFAFVILNRFPYNSGHLMISPFRHTAEWETLTPDEHAEIAVLTSRAMNALKQTTHPHGFNLGVNQGTVAGAGFADHVHLHVVPRWGGDTNFMTATGEVKVIPESLEATFEKLKPYM